MTRKDELKKSVYEKIEGIFDVVGYKDKKLYIQVEECQFAISITAPKVLLEKNNIEEAQKTPEPLSESEQDLVQKLIDELRR